MGGEGPGGGRQLSSFVLTPLWENGLYHWKGECCRKADGHPPVPSICPDGCPHPHICAVQGMGNLHRELEEYRPRSQVWPALPPQGAIAEISNLTNPSEGTLEDRI